MLQPLAPMKTERGRKGLIASSDHCLDSWPSGQCRMYLLVTPQQFTSCLLIMRYILHWSLITEPGQWSLLAISLFLPRSVFIGQRLQNCCSTVGLTRSVGRHLGSRITNTLAPKWHSPTLEPSEKGFNLLFSYWRHCKLFGAQHGLTTKCFYPL